MSEEEAFLAAEEERQAKEEKEQAKAQRMQDKERMRDKALANEKNQKDLKGEKDEHVEGKLRMADVQALPEEVDDILGSLGSMNFGVQDLDILIELSKQLKTKRLKLFPDTSYVFSLQSAGLSNDQIDKANLANEEDTN